MGRRGPPPKPTKLKIVEGNPGKRKLNDREPAYAAGAVCPEWLEPEGKAEWERLAPELDRMGMLTVADQHEFAAYCQAFARWRQAQERITESGLELAIAKGYVNAAQKARQDMQRTAAKFGFTPSDRTGIRVPDGGTTNPAAQFFRRPA